MNAPKAQADEAAGLELWFGSTADPLLEKHGLVHDDPSRLRLLRALRRAMEQATETLTRRSHGDYGPDAHVETFPALPAPKGAPVDTPSHPSGPSLRGLFDGWATEHQRNGRVAKTVEDFRHKVQSLVACLGHDDAAAVTVADVVRWKDALLEKGLSARTVSDKYLVAVRNLYRHAKANAMDLADRSECFGSLQHPEEDP